MKEVNPLLIERNGEENPFEENQIKGEPDQEENVNTCRDIK